MKKKSYKEKKWKRKKARKTFFWCAPVLYTSLAVIPFERVQLLQKRKKTTKKYKTKTERWLSGRKRLIANPLYEIPSYRGFESLSLRNTRLFLHFPFFLALLFLLQTFFVANFFLFLFAFWQTTSIFFSRISLEKKNNKKRGTSQKISLKTASTDWNKKKHNHFFCFCFFSSLHFSLFLTFTLFFFFFTFLQKSEKKQQSKKVKKSETFHSKFLFKWLSIKQNFTEDWRILQWFLKVINHLYLNC